MTMFSMAGTTPDRTLSIIYGNGDTATIPETHGRFDELVSLLLSGAEDGEVSELVDLMLAVSKKLEQLSERVSIKGRTILFDGDPLRGELADVLVDLHEAGNAESLRPVVNFLEKASTNPSRQSVDELYRWISKGDLIIHEDGDFLAYKGVRVGDDGVRTSISLGTAFVNGEEFTGYIPNPDGAVVSMPRADVDDNKEEACSTGLHAGTHYYAEWFRNHYVNGWYSNDKREAVMLLVKINPRDVVSVPTDELDQKLRVCRYVVQEEVEGRRSSRLYTTQDASLADTDTDTDEESDAEVGYWDVTKVVFATEGQEELDLDGEEDDVEDDDDIENAYEPTEDEQAELESDQWLATVRQRITEAQDAAGEEDAKVEVEYTDLTEAQLEANAAGTETLRDSKGRFTTEGSRKAVRNSKGQFIRWS